jgi:hypothetical protein
MSYANHRPHWTSDLRKRILLHADRPRWIAALFGVVSTALIKLFVIPTTMKIVYRVVRCAGLKYDI